LTTLSGARTTRLPSTRVSSQEHFVKARRLGSLLTLFWSSTVMKETVTLLNHLSAFYIDMTRDSLYSDLPDLPARQVVRSIFQAVSPRFSQASFGQS
jgi:isoleucyl-tRNA synthetase